MHHAMSVELSGEINTDFVQAGSSSRPFLRSAHSSDAPQPPFQGQSNLQTDLRTEVSFDPAESYRG